MASATSSETRNRATRMTVSNLQAFLVSHGVVVSGLRKAELSDLAEKAYEIGLRLQFDPDGLLEDREEVVGAKLCDGITTLTNPMMLGMCHLK